ncbi:hypothetical protein D3C79_657330 [compost metagenome]
MKLFQTFRGDNTLTQIGVNQTLELFYGDFLVHREEGLPLIMNLHDGTLTTNPDQLTVVVTSALGAVDTVTTWGQVAVHFGSATSIHIGVTQFVTVRVKSCEKLIHGFTLLRIREWLSPVLLLALWKWTELRSLG